MSQDIIKSQEQGPESDEPTVAPPVDIFENDDEILLIADVPGVERHNIDVRYDGQRVMLRARRSAAKQDGLVVAEFGEHDFQRSFLIPVRLQADQIRAEFDAGVLRVHMPKAASSEPRRIAIKAV